LSRKQADVIFSLLILAIVGWMVWQARAWDLRAGLFPLAIGVPAVGLAVLQLVFAVRGPRVSQAALSAAAPLHVSASEAVIAEAVEHAFGAGSIMEEEESLPSDVVRRRTLEMVAWILVMATGIVLLGFELGAAVVSLLFLRLRAHESWRTSAAIALSTYLFLYVVFDRALNIPLPNGAIADALGLNAFDHYLTDPIANFIQRR
jgi:ABC-type multidrug transport system fused ATPase/permease subunit